ncbi:MAG: signal peptidase II, partial [Erysipelotrichia bacterium]|nr:signal peptidase II [Erysipelotrichia bacterium]
MEWILMGILIFADQISKYMVQISQPMEIEVVPHFFYITYVRNDGAAWNMLAGKQVFLSLIAAVAIGAMLYYLIKGMQADSAKMNRIALACMIAGAAGNLIDRLLLNYVRD